MPAVTRLDIFYNDTVCHTSITLDLVDVRASTSMRFDCLEGENCSAVGLCRISILLRGCRGDQSTANRKQWAGVYRRWTGRILRYLPPDGAGVYGDCISGELFRYFSADVENDEVVVLNLSLSLRSIHIDVAGFRLPSACF